jgi:hypothetical protein
MKYFFQHHVTKVKEPNLKQIWKHILKQLYLWLKYLCICQIIYTNDLTKRRLTLQQINES